MRAKVRAKWIELKEMVLKVALILRKNANN